MAFLKALPLFRCVVSIARMEPQRKDFCGSYQAARQVRCRPMCPYKKNDCPHGAHKCRGCGRAGHGQEDCCYPPMTVPEPPPCPRETPGLLAGPRDPLHGQPWPALQSLRVHHCLSQDLVAKVKASQQIMVLQFLHGLPVQKLRLLLSSPAVLLVCAHHLMPELSEITFPIQFQ